MRELELDGIHDDGEHLLLVDSDGERYTLRIDKALRAAVRTDRPALNMIQAADAAPLRPREIQAMLRGGRSAEDIAEVSEIPLEHVRRYEGPVLAEREWTAQRARTFPVGRGGPALQDVVAERLAAREASGDTAWDAWRRQDGTWTLELTFSAGGRTRQAHWVADIDNRSVSPVDDEARWISDEDAPLETRSGRGRLQSVKSSVYDLEADGSLEGAPATRSRSWPRRPVSDEHPSIIDDEDLEALNARRGLRSVPRPDDSAGVWSGLDEADDTETAAIEVTDPATDPTSTVRGGAEDPHALGAGPAPVDDHDDRSEDPAELDDVPVDADQEAEREHTAGGVHGVDELDATDPDELDDAAAAAPLGDDATEDAQQDGGSAGSEDGIRYQDTVDLTPLPGFDDDAATADSAHETTGSDDKPAKKTSKSSKARSKRASMPSWDEIVFGSKHD
ncbi:septation protein SepH [Brachybacterium sp. AOP43-C2-M15]|uniref:septation protein SepH n=1 Tax=Brachybacterium sp. AOP43-C2-M15 TaxID=3457661 RepID=UPI0040331AEB